MAGDYEEPFRLGFQADSLHSGSISFGRFEAESLSWERRSSFSHNRYLEEVEKYSKPGSVTEKKAYFEAHLKKKSLLRQSSSECQNGTEDQIIENENGDLQNMGYIEEFEIVNDAGNFTFDESPHYWEYDGEREVMKSEREDMGVFYSEPQVEPVINSVDVVDSVPEHVKPEEALQTKTENLLLINIEPEIVEGLHYDIVHVHGASKAIDTASSSHTDEKDFSVSSRHQRIPSPKVRTASETKPTKPRSNSQANVSQVQGTTSSEASSDSAKKPSRRENEGSLRIKTEKKLSQTAAPTTHSMGRPSKSEDFGSSKEKIIHDKKSIEKELRVKKAVESQSSASETINRARQTANRPKPNGSSSKPGMKQSATVFSFKSDERAERRKEYFMMLEEKMHAKEAEMNQIQAKTLEKAETEIKQLRKSLNFKATPMPYFYHESARGSARNKAISSNTKSSKLRSKTSSNPRAGAAESSPSYLNTGNDQALSASESVNTADPPETSGVINSSVPFDTSMNSPTTATNRNHPSEGGMNNGVTGKKEQEKEKDSKSRKYIVSDGSKIVRGQRVEEKRKMGGGRSSNDMIRKDMKGVSG